MTKQDNRLYTIDESMLRHAADAISAGRAFSTVCTDLVARSPCNAHESVTVDVVVLQQILRAALHEIKKHAGQYAPKIDPNRPPRRGFTHCVSHTSGKVTNHRTFDAAHRSWRFGDVLYQWSLDRNRWRIWTSAGLV